MYFSGYKEHISFNKFKDVLPAITCARAGRNL